MSSKFGVLFAAAFFVLTGTANASTYSFSFTDDPSIPDYFGRVNTAGTVTGLLFGLGDNGFFTPTSIEITSDESAHGLTSSPITNFDVVVGTGFDLSAGSIIGANW